MMSTILTDSWGGYVSLAEVGYSHGMVNHSKNFVHPDNKFIHTQKVENLWRWLKDFLKKKGTNRITHLNQYLVEYHFRKMHPDDCFQPLLEAVKVTH